MEASASVIEFNYPPRTQAPQCLITIPHASHGGDFFKNFPQLVEVFAERRELLDRFLRLEHDAGSQNLAHAVGGYLDRDFGIATRVLFSHHMHRGFVDPNRLPGSAVRPVIDYAQYPGLKEVLEAEHRDIVAQMRAHLARIPNLSNVVAIDLHTMAPYTPKVDPSSTTEAVTLTPDNMEAYVRAFTDPQFRGSKRPIDILTAIPGEGPIGDPALVYRLEDALAMDGFTSGVNDPYPLSPVLISSEIVRQTRGVALDVPKDLIGITRPDGEIDLTNIEPDMVKIARLAQCIARAIAETVQTAPVRVG